MLTKTCHGFIGWLAAGLCVGSLGGCAFGVQQVVVVPPIGGTWQFSGTEHTVTTPPGVNGKPASFSVQADPRQGRLAAVQSATQIALSVDLPWARLGISPAITGDERLDYIQLDLLYKHAIDGQDPARWRALAGLTYAIVEAREFFEKTLELPEPVVVGGAVIRTGDTFRYEANEFVSGWMLTGGLEYEIMPWCHAYLQMSAGLGRGTKERGEDLQIIARDGSTFDDQGNRETETFHLLSNSQFDVTTKQQGVFRSEVGLPPFSALLGISVTFPPYNWYRRGQPKPRPRVVSPPPPSAGEHPPEGWPQRQVPRLQ